MASVFPTKISEFIQFCEDHAGVWRANANQIGLTTIQAQEWESKVNKLRGALTAQNQAKQAAMNATVALHDLVADARADGNDLLRIIRGYAGQQPEPNTVYIAADIPPPAAPTPLPAPAQPSDVRVGIDIDSGALILTWKASNPPGAAGTSYIIKRRINNTGAYEFVGVTGGAEKKFTDDTFPAGSDSVTYSIQGQRGNVPGPTRVVTVNFGVSNGQMVVRSVKMAA